MQIQDPWFRTKNAFEEMDDEAQELLARIAEQYARDWPARRARPKLALVTQNLDGGALVSALSGREDRFSPPVSGSAVKV